VSISPTSATLDVGQSQTFTASASGGSGTYSSYLWYVGGVVVPGETGSSYTFTSSSADSVSIYATVTDSFGVTSVASNTVSVSVNQLTITVTQTANGLISPGTSPANYGDTPTFSITPNTGYHIASITANGASVTVTTPAGQSYQFSAVSAERSLTATFAINTFTISASAGANGAITPTGSVSVNYGGSQTFTITPNNGYTIASLSVDGSAVAVGSSYTFSNVVASHTISATFAPTGTYSYIISVSGSNYQMTDGTTGQIVFQSTSSSKVFSNVVGNCSVGSSIDVESGVYAVNTMWLIAQTNGITVNFENGAKLVAGNNLNAPVLFLYGVDNCNILGVTIDGNAANQVAGGSSVLTRPDGIFIAGSNDEVDNALIYDCRETGVEIGNFGNTVHSGAINSKIYNCGWNGFTDGAASDLNCYLMNSEIYGCSDVGASTYGIGTLIAGNYVHDLNGTTGGGGNGYWGIAVEGGQNNIITNNIINNTRWGILVDNSGNALVGTTDNTTIANNKIFNSATGGIHLAYGTEANLVTGNQITRVSSPGDSYGAFGIDLNSACFNSIIGNYVSQSDCYGVFLDLSSNNNTLTGNYIFDNGLINTGSTGDQSGIRLDGNSNFLSGNYIYDDRSGSSRTQLLGIDMSSNAPKGNVLMGNYLSNNVDNNIYDPNVPENTYINNTGYNPVGYIASPISGSTAYLVDSGSNSTWISGRVYTNTGSPKVLDISAGTVSVVAQNGVTLFTATGCTVTLQSGDTFSVTFSTTPTIKVTGQ
jgi:parallel beta-helix repeat protein